MRVSGASGLVLVAGVLLCHCSSDPAGPPGGNPPVDSGVRPPASAGHDLVYDDALQRVLLVNAGLGGTTAPPSTQPTQLWSWNGAQWRVLDSAGPPIRSLAGVAYDSTRDVLVMHGGSYTIQVPYGDTWEWRADAGWRRIDVPGPGILDHTQMSDDPLHGQVVLFGGQRDLTTFPEDVWTFDGGQWTPLAGAGPGSRVHHAMQYHPGFGGVVVFGGFVPGVSDRGDTWLWNGAWAEVAPPRLPRTHARMAFDEGRGTMVLVGGASSADEPLVLRDAGWEPLGVAGAPPPRYLPGVAYDRARGVLVVFGGGNPANSALLDDTWELGAAGWRRVDPP
ncbi:MAG TPA: hypothetical protein VFD38_14160 [Myxococcaceae bacterium]|nr:hypothetical protein [Myxococcaceae bacterium]